MTYDVSNKINPMIEFLNESNKIENITALNHYDKNYQDREKGHYGALIQSQESAKEGKALTHKMVRHWQGLITREQLQFNEHIEERHIGRYRDRGAAVGGHLAPSCDAVPTLMDYLIEKINEGLKDQNTMDSEEAYFKFLGKSFREFERIHPFADGNGRTGRILANYIATFCKRKFLIFPSEQSIRNEYYKAHESPEAMVKFMKEKICHEKRRLSSDLPTEPNNGNPSDEEGEASYKKIKLE